MCINMFNYLTFTCIPEKVPGYLLGCFVLFLIFFFLLLSKYSLNGLELKLFGLQNTVWERNCPPSGSVIGHRALKDSVLRIM